MVGFSASERDITPLIGKHLGNKTFAVPAIEEVVKYNTFRGHKEGYQHLHISPFVDHSIEGDQALDEVQRCAVLELFEVDDHELEIFLVVGFVGIKPPSRDVNIAHGPHQSTFLFAT